MIDTIAHIFAFLNPIMFFICTCLWAYIGQRMRIQFSLYEIKLNKLEHLVLYGDDVIKRFMPENIK